MNSINPEKTTDELVAFLKKTFTDAGFSSAVIALSGGVDSATSCALTVRALGSENVYPVLLPFGVMSAQATIDATSVIGALGINAFHVTRVDIQPIIERVLPPDNIRRGNMMARTRMMVLYDQAKKRNALVVGTENKTEYLLGYFTRFGDEASDVEPLRNLYKTQVYELAKFLGIPNAVLTKTPTAGLWEGQTDEGEFGFTYKEADEILYQHFELKQEVTGFPKEVIEKVLARAKANDFKHRLPILP